MCLDEAVLEAGGMDSYVAQEAISAVSTGQLSTALFAPGWVFENLSKDWARLEKNLALFWNKLRPFFETRPVASLPFLTYFGEGVGKKLFIDGADFSGDVTAWFNLNTQTFLPNITSNVVFEVAGGSVSGVAQRVLPNPLRQTDICYEDAFNGGSCLKIFGRAPSVPLTSGLFDPKSTKFKRSVVRVFKSNFELCEPLTVEYCFKTTPADIHAIGGEKQAVDCKVYLQFVLDKKSTSLGPGVSGSASADESLWYLVLSGKSAETKDSGSLEGQYPASNPSEIQDPSSVQARTKDSLSLSCVDEEQVNGWTKRRFNINHSLLRLRKIEEIRIVCIPFFPSGPTLLPSAEGSDKGLLVVRIGEIKIFRTSDLQMGAKMRIHDFRVEDVDVVEQNCKQGGSMLTVSLTLDWKCDLDGKTLENSAGQMPATLGSEKKSGLSIGEGGEGNDPSRSRNSDFVECFDIYLMKPVKKNEKGTEFAGKIFLGKSFVEMFRAVNMSLRPSNVLAVDQANARDAAQMQSKHHHQIYDDLHLGVQAISGAGLKSSLFLVPPISLTPKA